MARRSYRNWKDTDTPPLFKPESNWRPPSFEDLPQSWKGIKRIGLDTETNDKDLRKLGPGVRRGGYIVGVSFAIEDGPKFYLPTRHRGGDNMNETKVFQYLKDRSKEFTGSICGANLGYDVDYLAQAGVDLLDHDLRDIQVAEPLLDENKLQYSLEATAKGYGFQGKNEDALRDAAMAYGIDAKKDMWKLPARYVGLYAEDDADLPLKILRRQERLIEQQGLQGMYDLERRVQPILIRMRRHGVRIDFDHLDRVEQWTMVQEQLLLDEIARRTNIRICVDEINKKTLTARALDAAGLPYDRTPTGQPKINTELLMPLAKDNKVASAIIHAKYLNKLRNTFVKSIRSHQVNGRIHATLNQLKRQGQNSETVVGAGPGRMSSSNPNLQQQPGRKPNWWALDTPVHIFWRKIYLPDEGGMWAAMDYSGQEPRMLTHFAALCNCPGAAEAVHQANTDPNWDFHNTTTELAFGATPTNTEPKEFKFLRGRAKIIFLGLVYGMGGGKLCRSLGFPVEIIKIKGEEREVAGPEGKKFLEEFNRRVPFLQEIKKMVEGVAWNRRHIVTLLGRHIHYQAGFGNERKALNNLIQGSSADQTKLAMVKIYEAGFSLQLQVHDEFDTTVYNKSEAYDIAKIMIDCVSLKVPSKVDVELGSSWGHSMENELTNV